MKPLDIIIKQPYESIYTDKKNKISNQWPKYMIRKHTSCRDIKDEP